jgi:hypothetical protein
MTVPHEIRFWIRVLILVLYLSTVMIATGTTGLSDSDSETSVISFLHSPLPPPPDDPWKDKVSSDLLQLLDPDACPPGRTPADIARDMEILGQLRFAGENTSEVHVTVIMNDGGNSSLIRPLLNDSVIDLSFGLITGWVSVQNISVLANLSVVRDLQAALPPAGSGNVCPNPSLLPPLQESPGASWKGKLSTDLLQLLDDHYLSPGQPPGSTEALMRATGELRSAPDNTSEVMITAQLSKDQTTDAILSLFDSAESDSTYGRISGWMSIPNLSVLVRQPGVLSVMAQIPAFTSQTYTEGDKILNTDEFRKQTNLTGTGVAIGIISDGVNSLDEVIAEGELPSDVHVLRNSVGGDEGTAMLQIVHDISPDAKLYFHDRGSSQIEFVQAMDRLIRQGCRIICDDITYVEPFFEDGYIARNIRDRILSYGILYITSAGNFAREHYQAPFNGYMDRGYAWHDFNGSHGSRDLKFTASANSAGHIILQWDDRFGESSNNYDLFLYNSDKREIGRSVKIQDGDDDPMEYCRFINQKETEEDFYLRVVQAGGENRTIEIYVLPLGGSPVSMDPCVPEDSLFGQQAVPEALSVAAVKPNLNLTEVQPYSSRGPVTIKYPSPELRQKPEIAAPDSVLVSAGSATLGTFSGTSASAPHIAGLAALLWSSNLYMKEEEIRDKLINATPFHEREWDPSIGYGVPDALLLISDLTNVSSDISDGVHLSPISRSLLPREMEQPEALALYPGWNMISIPYPLEDGMNTGSIFCEVNTSSHTIWRYSVEQSHWVPVGLNDNLGQMDVIWVFSENQTGIDLKYDDSRQNMTARHLTPGWNPVGIPGQSTKTAREFLAPLGSSWSYILVFDPRTQQYRPAIVNGGTGAYSDQRLLYPTEGFWMYMNNPGIIIP